MKPLIAAVTLLAIVLLGVGGGNILLLLSDLANDLRAPSVAAADVDGPAPELGDPAALAEAPSGDHIPGHIELRKEDGESAQKVLEEVFSEQNTDQPNAANPRALAQDYREIERRAARLAEELQQSRGKEGAEAPQGEEARSALKGAVEAAFEARERWQLAELALLRSRLERLEQGVKRRAQARGEIIARRVQELLESEFIAETDVTPADISPINSQGTGVRPGTFPRSSPASSAAAPARQRDTVTTSVRESLLQKLTAAEVELELERASVTAQRKAFERAVKEQPAASQKQAESELEGDPRVVQLRQQMRELQKTVRVRNPDSPVVKSSQSKIEELEARLVELKAEFLPEIQERLLEQALFHERRALAKAEDSLRQRERVVELLHKKVDELRRSAQESASENVRELLRKKLIDAEVDIELGKAGLGLLREKSSGSSDDEMAIVNVEESLRNSESAAALIRQSLNESTVHPKTDARARETDDRRAARIWLNDSDAAEASAKTKKRPAVLYVHLPDQTLDAAATREWMRSPEILDLLEASFIAARVVDNEASFEDAKKYPLLLIIAPDGNRLAQFAGFSYDDRLINLLRKIAAEYDTREAAEARSPLNSSTGNAAERRELVRTIPADEPPRSSLIESAADPREKLVEADETAKQAEIRYQRAKQVLEEHNGILEQFRRKYEADPSTGQDFTQAEESNYSARKEFDAAELAHRRSRRQLEFAREDLAARVRLLELDFKEAELRLDSAKSAEARASRLVEKGYATTKEHTDLLHAVKRAELDIERTKIQLDLYRKTLSENGGSRPGSAEAAEPAETPPATVPDSKKAAVSEKNDDSPASQKPAQSAEEGRIDRGGARKPPTPYLYDAVNYAWLRGTIERDASEVRLRYSEGPAKDDLYGGSMRLVGKPEIESLKDGTVALVRGWVDPREKDGKQNPSYRVEKLIVLTLRDHVTHPGGFPHAPGPVVFRVEPDENHIAALATADATYQHRVKWASRMQSIWEEARANLDKGRRAARTDPSKSTLLPKLEEEFRLAQLQKERATAELAKSEERLRMLRRRRENRAEWSKSGNSSETATGPSLVDP